MGWAEVIGAVVSLVVSEATKKDATTPTTVAAQTPQAEAKKAEQGYYKRDTSNTAGSPPAAGAVDPFFLSADETTKKTLGG